MVVVEEGSKLKYIFFDVFVMEEFREGYLGIL